MKYSEKLIDFKVENPVQLMVMIMFSIVSAPGRLMSEIAKKIILLGKHATKFFLLSVVLNTVIICLNSLYMLFVEKRINLVFGRMSIASMAFSMLLCVSLFVFFSKLMVNYSEEEFLESSDDSKSNNSVSTDIYEEGDRGSGMELLLKEIGNLGNGTVTENLENSKIENLSESDLEDIFKEIPRNKIDPVYAHERESRMKRMAQMLESCDANSDLTDKELKFLQKPDKPSDFVSGLSLDAINESDDENGLEEFIRNSRSKEATDEIDSCFFDDILNN